MSYRRVTDPDAANPERPRAVREKNKGIGRGNAPGSRRNIGKSHPGQYEGRGDRGPNKVDRVLKRDCTLRTLAMEGILPLEYMLGVMRDESASTERRDDMAKSAAPFLHPRLQSIEMKADVVQNVVSERPLTAAEWAAEHAADDGERPNTAH